MWTSRVVWPVVAVAALLPVTNAQARDSACSHLPAVAAPDGTVAWRAGIHMRTAVFDRLPADGAPPSRRLAPARAPWLLILAPPRAAGDRCWVRVRLPWRPNDAAGWVDADNVVIEPTRWRIEISTRGRTLTLYREGERIRTVRVVVGKPSTPTPMGRFAVAGVFRGRPNDFLGSWVLTLTAHSTVLRRFDGGDGTVGIHGRGGASLRDPLGSARSHGCVRLTNDAISRIVRTIGADQLPGTPVNIS
jgi:lipoprotein-anchoring transpeptidase ErfK/SrfK